MLNIFRRKPENHGRELAKLGVEKRRAKVRSKVDEMRRELGLPAVDWANL